MIRSISAVLTLNRTKTPLSIAYTKSFATESDSHTNHQQREKREPLIKRLVQVKRVSHTTKLGKQRSIYALVNDNNHEQLAYNHHRLL